LFEKTGSRGYDADASGAENIKNEYAPDIRDTDSFQTAITSGKVPLVSVKDIGQVAANALVADKIEHNVVVLLGPELFTFDDVSLCQESAITQA